MDAFIKKEQYNAIYKYMKDFATVLKFCPDEKIIESNRIHCEMQIVNLFDNLNDQEMKYLQLAFVDGVGKVDEYLQCLDEYVFGMNSVSQVQLKKLFKKEKNLKVPSDEYLKRCKVYLGWNDSANKKLYIAYYVGNALLGMACRVQPPKPESSNICKLCNHVGSANEVALYHRSVKGIHTILLVSVHV